MVKKVFSKKMTIVIFIFFITNVSYNLKAFAEYTNVKAMPQYVDDGSWGKIYKDPSDSSKLRTNLDNCANVYSDLVNLIQLLITNNKNNIYIMDGDYDLNDMLLIDVPGITILGQSNTGTKLVLKKPSVNCIKVRYDNVQIANLNIDGSASGTSEMIHAQRVNGFNLTNCKIKGSGSGTTVALYGEDVNLNSNNVISGNTIEEGTGTMGEPVLFLNQTSGVLINNTVSHGWMKIQSCNDVWVDSNTSNNSIKSGIYVELSSNNIYIINNTINSPKESGIDVKLQSENIKIINNTINNSEGSGIYIHGPDSDYRANGFSIQKNIINTTKDFGIDINNLDSGIISRNEISNTDYHGIYVLRSDNLNIENNKILNCEKNSDLTPAWNAPKSAIYLEAKVKNSSIQGNYIENTTLCDYGIRIENGKNNLGNNILSNSVSGNFTEFVSTNLGNPEYTEILEKNTVTDKSISLKWIKMNPSATYKIKRIDEGGVEREADVNTETYVDTGLDSNKNYTYKISIDGTNWSEGIPIKTLRSPPPNITTSATENSIKVNWDEVDATTEYEIEVDGSLIPVDVDTHESYEHTGLLSGSTHNYRVRIKGGQWSGVITETTLTPPPPILPPTPPPMPPTVIIPQNLRIAATTESSIKIVWDEVDSETEYDLEVDGVVVPVGTKENYEHTGLMSGLEYKYRVRIKNGQWSGDVYGKTLDSKTPLVIIPQNLRIAATTESSIKIVWDEVDSETEYDLEVDGVVVPVGTNEIYEHTSLLIGSTHRYRVRIKNGQWSQPVWGTTLDLKTPEVIVPQDIRRTTPTRNTSSSKRTKNNNNDDTYDKVEIYFGNKSGFIFDNPLLEKVQVDMLNRIFLCRFGENYYFGIRAWKDNKLKRETEYKISLTPENKLTFNKIYDKVNHIDYEIKEILIQDTVEHIFYVNDFENITLSKYMIDNGYVISIDDVKMKSKKNNKYSISESFIG